MGITERKTREKEDLRRKILDAARSVFLEKGYEHTSIRNIAERIEYSPTTIYLYFKDKDAIFYALHIEGFQLMGQQMQVLSHVADPFERLMAMGRVYLNFAVHNAEYYNLMFVDQAPINYIDCGDHQVAWEVGMGAFDVLKHTVGQCMDSGYIKKADGEVTSFVIWSTLHGMVTLYNRERCEKVISEENKSDILEKGLAVFSALLNSMKSTN